MMCSEMPSQITNSFPMSLVSHESSMSTLDLWSLSDILATACGSRGHEVLIPSSHDLVT